MTQIEMEKAILNFIKNDDYVNLRTFVETNRPVISENVYIECAKHLALDCFTYFLSIRTRAEIQRDQAFIKLAREKAQLGKNFDDRDFWKNSHKRNARTPPPPKYSASWDCSVTEDVFYAILVGMKDNHTRAKSFINYLIMNEFPIGDNLYYQVNQTESIQGYVSMLHSYMMSGFNMFPGKKKTEQKNTRRHA